MTQSQLKSKAFAFGSRVLPGPVQLTLMAGLVFSLTAYAVDDGPGSAEDDRRLAVNKTCPSVQEEDLEVVESRQLAFIERILDSDVDGMLKFYTKDAVVMPPNAPAAYGHDQVEYFLANLFSRFSFETLEVELMTQEHYGDCHVPNQGHITYTLVPVGGGDPIHFEGSFIEIWEQQEDREWKMTQDIWNSDVPFGG